MTELTSMPNLPSLHGNMTDRLFLATHEVDMNLSRFKKRFGKPTYDVIKMTVKKAAKKHKVDPNRIHMSFVGMNFGRLSSRLDRKKRQNELENNSFDGILIDDE